MTLNALEGGGLTAIRGRMGYLFLQSAPGLVGNPSEDLLSAYQNVSAWVGPYVERWHRAILARSARLEAEGIAHVVMLNPDAHYVMAECLPEGVTLEWPSPSERLAAALRASGVKVVSSLHELRSAIGVVEVWRRNDTHWASFGAQIAAAQLLQACGGAKPVRVPHWSERRYRSRNVFGDLGVTVTPQERAPNTVVTYPGSTARLVQERTGRGRSNLLVYESDAKDAPSVVVFRRSFFTEIVPHVSGQFRRMVLVGGAHPFFMDLVRDERPDIVVTELAERMIFFNQADHTLVSADNFFSVDKSSVAGRLLIRAELATTAKERLAVSAMALAAGAPLSRVIAHMAGALVSLDALPEAREMLATYLEQEPGDLETLVLAADAARRDNDMDSARTYNARALHMAPDNALVLRQYAELAFAESRFDEMADAYRRLTPLTPNDADNWVWASVAYGRVGEAAASLDAAETAVAVAPDGFYMLQQLANALLGVGRYADAIAICDRLTAMRPADQMTHQMLGFLRKLIKPDVAPAA